MRDSAGVVIVESAGTSGGADSASPFVLDSAPVVSIGVESGAEVDMLHRVRDAERLPDGRILVANAGTHELRLYASDGAHLANIGRKGGGPGEFGDFSSLRLYRYGDTVLVSDDDAMRMHVLAPSLEFADTRPFQVSPAVGRPLFRHVFADGTWLALAFDGGGALRGPTLRRMPVQALRCARTCAAPAARLVECSA